LFDKVCGSEKDGILLTLNIEAATGGYLRYSPVRRDSSTILVVAQAEKFFLTSAELNSREGSSCEINSEFPQYHLLLLCLFVDVFASSQRLSLLPYLLSSRQPLFRGAGGG
jgi:hypothetical protein